MHSLFTTNDISSPDKTLKDICCVQIDNRKDVHASSPRIKYFKHLFFVAQQTIYIYLFSYFVQHTLYFNL